VILLTENPSLRDGTSVTDDDFKRNLVVEAFGYC
jgi:hypothetical protein